jgi:iron(III) transport system substrate-binding protein
MKNRSRRLPASLAAVVAAGLVLAGCGSSGEGGSADPTDAAAAPASGDTLIVYTNSNGDGRGDWVTAEAEKAGFDIEIVGLGGADLANRIVAEKNNPVGDVVFGLNHMYFENLKAEDAITADTPAWSGEVDEASGDPEDGAYWPLVEQAIVTVHDSAKTSGGDVPKDVTDLYSSEYEGRYEVNTRLGEATPQLILAGLLAPYEDEDGDLGISDDGWEVVEEYFANGSPSVEGTDLYARLSRDEVAFGTLPSSGIAARDEQYGTTTAVVPSKDGVPFVTEQIAEIAGTKKEERARAFIDWFGSADVQGAFAEQFSSYPVNTTAREKALPAVKELIESLEKQDVDYGFVRENIADWVEKTELEYLP